MWGLNFISVSYHLKRMDILTPPKLDEAHLGVYVKHLPSLRGPRLAIPCKRQQDVYLMDAFVDCELPKAALGSLNECWLFLHASMLADITTADGNEIEASAWQCCWGHSQCYPVDTWIHSHDPGSTAWALWRVALCRLFLFPNVQHLRLCTPLGAWFCHDDEHWQWWLHSPSSKMYCTHKDGKWSHSTLRWTQGNQRVFNTDIPVCCAQVPPIDGMLCGNILDYGWCYPCCL